MTTIEHPNDVQIEFMKNPEFSPTVKKSIDNIIKNEGYIKHTKYERQISTNGGNYLGDLFEVDIRGKTSDGDKETNLFIKRIITSEGLTILSTQDIQNREILAYCELNRICTELMDEANIPNSERFRQAKCYDANSEVMILENLTVKGFKTTDRTEALTLEFAESAIKQLAKFHGLSFAIQNKRPAYFDTNLKTLKSPFIFSSHLDKVFSDLFNKGCELLDEKEAKRITKAFEQIFDLKNHYEKDQRCLCHGDYRTNNMLIQMEEGAIVDLVPVDFQLIYYGNPVNDFMYFLIAHSDQEFRRLHMNTLKELYYKHLGEFLQYFEIELEEVYPRRVFDSDFKNRLIFGLMSSICLLTFLFAKEDATPDLADMESMDNKVQLQDGAKDRIRGIVDDYINWGVI